MLVARNIVSMPGISAWFVWASCISFSKSVTARRPRTITEAWRFLANSTVRPSKLSTVTFGMSLQHSRSSATRSSTVNRGFFALLMSTATMSWSFIFAARLMMSRCPLVTGSKDPG